MSTTTVTTVTCDIDGCANKADHKGKVISVRFLTDTTDGRGVPPYISGDTLDFCRDHYQQYIDTLPLEGHGAQGNNTYTFK